MSTRRLRVHPETYVAQASRLCLHRRGGGATRLLGRALIQERLTLHGLSGAVALFPALFLALVVVPAAGCGGGGAVGVSIRKPAGERPDLDQAVAAKGALLIPSEGVFNLTSFESGQTGTARGESQASGADGAVCRAEARDGGTAWGGFKLGYCFDNMSGGALEASIEIRLRTEGSALRGESAGAAAPASATAQSTLVFVIKDTNGLEIRKERLFSSSLETGPGSSGATYDRVFDARLRSNRGYYLVLSGQTDVKAGPSASVSSSLQVADFSVRISWRGVQAGRNAVRGGVPDAGGSASVGRKRAS